MDESIISRNAIRARARNAHADGKGRDEHHMNWHSAAVAEWQAEWDCCEAEKRSRETGNLQLEAA